MSVGRRSNLLLPLRSLLLWNPRGSGIICLGHLGCTSLLLLLLLTSGHVGINVRHVYHLPLLRRLLRR